MLLPVTPAKVEAASPVVLSIKSDAVLSSIGGNPAYNSDFSYNKAELSSRASKNANGSFLSTGYCG